MDIKELMSMQVCDCGRFWCEFFTPEVGNYGTSYSAEELQEWLDELPKLQAHLKKLLKYKLEGENEV